jgi:hypothetical protein
MKPVKVSLLAGAILSGCGIIGPDCEDICGFSAEVRGIVQLESGNPVSGAQIELTLMWDGPGVGGEVTCQKAQSPEILRAMADSDGRFVSRLSATNLSLAQCVELTVIPPPMVHAKVSVDTLLIGWSRERSDPWVVETTVVLAGAQ